MLEEEPGGQQLSGARGGQEGLPLPVVEPADGIGVPQPAMEASDRVADPWLQLDSLRHLQS